MFCLQTLSTSIEFLFDKRIYTLNAFIGTAVVNKDVFKKVLNKMYNEHNCRLWGLRKLNTLKPWCSEQVHLTLFCLLYWIIHYIKCDMLSNSSKWELSFVHYYREIHYTIEVRYIEVWVNYVTIFISERCGIYWGAVVIVHFKRSPMRLQFDYGN